MQSLKRQTVGHYALQKQLSQKVGRQTFIAKDLETNTVVIVKVLQIDGDFNWDELKLFKREGQILQQLDHPAIPKYKDSFETEIDGVTSFVLVQDYIAAKSLQQIVESGQLFSEAEAIAIAQQLLATLSYLHQQLPPVIHRDIKPSNVLISDRHPPKSFATLTGIFDRSVYLVDFGAVQVAASKTSGTVTIVGSYGYMPLEQFLGQTTSASDLYSLGMLLIYLVTGLHPADLPEMDGRVQWQRLTAVAGISDRFTHWLSQLTEPYAAQRFESAAVALTVLNAEDGKNGYFPHLKPDTHRIHIHRQPDELKLISITPQPAQASTVVSRLGCLFPPLVIYVPVAVYQLLGGLGLMVVVFSCFAFCVVYYNIYKDVDRYAFIALHRKQGISAGTAIGRSLRDLRLFRKKQRTLPLSSVNFVSYSPEHTFRHFSDGKKRLRGRRKIDLCHIVLPATLSVHTTASKYTLFCGDLSVEEQVWITKELEDFLGLPLQTIAPANPSHPQASKIKALERQQPYEKVGKITQF